VEGYEGMVEGYEGMVEGYEGMVEGYEGMVEGYRLSPRWKVPHAKSLFHQPIRRAPKMLPLG